MLSFSRPFYVVLIFCVGHVAGACLSSTCPRNDVAATGEAVGGSVMYFKSGEGPSLLSTIDNLSTGQLFSFLAVKSSNQPDESPAMIEAEQEGESSPADGVTWSLEELSQVPRSIFGLPDDGEAAEQESPNGEEGSEADPTIKEISEEDLSKRAVGTEVVVRPHEVVDADYYGAEKSISAKRRGDSYQHFASRRRNGVLQPLDGAKQKLRQPRSNAEDEAVDDDASSRAEFDFIAWWRKKLAEQAAREVSQSSATSQLSPPKSPMTKPTSPTTKPKSPTSGCPNAAPQEQRKSTASRQLPIKNSGPAKRAPNPKTAHLSAFQKKSLESHNVYRSAVGIPLVEWDDSLAAFILDYMKQQDFYDGCTMKHSKHSQRAQVGPFTSIGENLYTRWGTNTPPAATRVAEAWFNEAFCYRYGAVGDSCTKNPGPKCKEKTGFGSYVMTGHFTQLMWSTVTHIGCDMITCTSYRGGGRKFFAGCSYASNTSGYGGNMVGEVPFDRATARRLGLPTCS